MTITLTTHLNHGTIPEGKPASLYLLIQVTAERAKTERPPLNLGAVIDRSGSMDGAKLGYTRSALAHLVDQTIPTDYLSIVTFDDQVETLLSADHILNKDALKARIHGIDTGGTTNLSGGLLAGYRETRRHQSKHRINRVLLMTDGQANVGITEPAALVAKAKEMNEKGVQLSALGVGADFNEDLLAAMAEAGGGNFHFIANPDQIPAIFAQELQGLLDTAAQGLVVTFRPAPGAEVTGVLGYRPDGERIALPDIYAGETKSLVLELQVEPAFAGDRWLGRLELTATAADGTDLRLAQDLSVTVADSTSPEDPAVMKQVYIARSAEALDQAIQAADRQDFATATDALRTAAAPLAAIADRTGDADLQEQVQQLARQAEALEARTYDAVARKQMRAQSFQTRRGRP